MQRAGLPQASVLRRCGAIVYDTLLLCAILLVATVVILPFTGGEAVQAGNPWFSAYIFAVCFLFFGWFWTHGGQTLGMRAWKLRLQRADGGAVAWWQALVRFLLASLWMLPMIYLSQVLGLGSGVSLSVGLGCLALMLLSRFYDRYSDTVVVRLPVPKGKSFDVGG